MKNNQKIPVSILADREVFEYLKEKGDERKTRTDKRHYRLGDAVLARVHLDVYLTNGHDDVNPGYGATDILDIEHHRHHEVVHRGQRVRSPAIVHAAAFGKSRVGEREAQRT